MKTILAVLALCSAPLFAASNDLTAYFIDVEGGQATLFVTPAGQSVLVDTGWAGFNGRDADRIAAVAKQVGVSQIDYLLITHFHLDHVGGVPALAAKLPIRNFVDHGETVEHDAAGQRLFDAYQKEIAKGNHIIVKPGDKLPLKGVQWTIVTAGGKTIEKPLPGAAKVNADCATFQKRDIEDNENGQSVGSFIQFGNFKTVDLGDLLWNKEQDLMCPAPKIPNVDLYITSHHGMDMSGSPSLIHGLHAKAAIMDNGSRKGGTAEAWDTMRKTPGLADVWQLHFATAGGKEHNSADDLIANLTDQPDAANTIKLVAHQDGHFEITNSRNGFSKKY
jgi:beta-lactamase superfamily II metal-dependent hydrolase